MATLTLGAIVRLADRSVHGFARSGFEGEIIVDRGSISVTSVAMVVDCSNNNLAFSGNSW